MVQINWTLQAKCDLQIIAEFISKSSKKYAKLQIYRITQRTKILKSQPFSGKLVQEIRREDIREIIEGNYRIIYKIINSKRIDILTIHHSARDLSKRKIQV